MVTEPVQGRHAFGVPGRELSRKRGAMLDHERPPAAAVRGEGWHGWQECQTVCRSRPGRCSLNCAKRAARAS